MERRRLLALVGSSAAVGLAGCSDGGNGDDNGTGDVNGDDNNSDGTAGQNGTQNGDGTDTADGNGDGNNSDSTGDQNETQNGDDNADGDDDNGDDPLISGAFRAQSTEGRVLFGEPDKEVWDNDRGSGLPPSARIPEPVVLEAELADDNSWEATNIAFPPLNIGVASVSPKMKADLRGELDQEAGLWTVTGQLTATIELNGDAYTVSFPLNATTGESGELEGSYEEQDGKIVATIVDNESVVDDTFGDPLIDDLLNLPGEFEGDNWFTLTMEIENAEE